MVKLPLPEQLTDIRWRSETKRWFNKETKEWQARTLYVRGTKGNRSENYEEPIRRMDKLLVVGVYNHITDTFEEVGFSWPDQREMWKAVMCGIFKLSERQKVYDDWQKAIENFVHEGGLNPLFVTVNEKGVI